MENGLPAPVLVRGDCAVSCKSSEKEKKKKRVSVCASEVAKRAQVSWIESIER